MAAQRELQSAAHTLYQQVARVLRQKALLERERTGRSGNWCVWLDLFSGYSLENLLLKSTDFSSGVVRRSYTALTHFLWLENNFGSLDHAPLEKNISMQMICNTCTEGLYIEEGLHTEMFVLCKYYLHWGEKKKENIWNKLNLNIGFFECGSLSPWLQCSNGEHEKYVFHLTSSSKPFVILSPGCCQHLLLATVFALNFHYQPVDLVVVIKCGILEILSTLTNNTCVLMNQRWLAASVSGHMLLSGAVKLACTRLLQILAIAARWRCREISERWH